MKRKGRCKKSKNPSLKKIKTYIDMPNETLKLPKNAGTNLDEEVKENTKGNVLYLSFDLSVYYSTNQFIKYSIKVITLITDCSMMKHKSSY